MPESSSPGSEERIFSEALAVPPDERQEFLARACADDAIMLSRIEALLRAHHATASPLDAAVGAALRAALSPAPGPEKPGTTIGRYKLLQKIGEGGCGTVYMAEQVEPVRRRVALKIIKPGMDTSEVIARFEAERQALALMDHPNIARVLDGGATDQGRPYFVMELVRGVPITRYCDEHHLTTPDRLALFMQVCHALQHAHQKGIIHRDLKPTNILVTLDGENPVPKVIDFGIAKATQGRLTDRTLFTAFEQFIGTPAYMSPEQAEMSSLDVDTRSDIYSLGVLLYELLTGQTPFDAKSLVQAGLDEVRRVIREVEPPKPSARLSTLTAADRLTLAKLRGTAPLQLTSQLSGDLDWIVMRCLEKDRKRRYETANSLALDLQRHLSHEPVAARPPGTAYLFQRFVRRHRLAFFSAAAITVALIAGLGLSTWEYFQEKAARERAVAAELKTQKEAHKSEQVAGLLKEMLTSAAPSVALGRDTTLIREILDRTNERVGTELKDQPEVEVELRSALVAAYIQTGDTAKAEAIARTALDLVKKTGASGTLAAADALFNLSSALFRNLDEAEPLAREALALNRRLRGNADIEVADSLNLVSAILIYKGQASESERYIREALAILRRLPSGDQQQTYLCSALNLQSGVALKKNDLVTAESATRELLAVQRALGARSNPVLMPNQLNILAWLLDLRGEPEKAELAIREAVAIQRKIMGPDHPDLAQSLCNLTSQLGMRGHYVEAEATIREALAISRKRGGDGGWETYKLAKVFLARGDLAAAEPVMRKALSLAQTNSGDDASSLEILAGLGEVLLRQGRDDEAEPLFQRTLPLLRKQNSPQSESDGPAQLAATLTNLGTILLHRGNVTGAEPPLREAFSLQAGLPPFYFIERIRTHVALAALLRQKGELAEAEKLLRAAETIAEGTPFFPPTDLRRALFTGLIDVDETWSRTEPTKAAAAAGWRERLKALDHAVPQ